VAGCCSDDQQSESWSKWQAFISNFLGLVREILRRSQLSGTDLESPGEIALGKYWVTGAAQ
jgi:hypothetical protein